MNMRMLIELAIVSMKSGKQADFDAEVVCVFEQGMRGTAKKLIEQRLVMVEKRSKQVRHDEGDILSFIVGQNMMLLGNPLFGGFHATGTAALTFTNLAEILSV